MNTAATFGLFVALEYLLSASAAYTVSYIAGVALSYLINTYLVFEERPSLRSALQFPSVYLIQYLTGLAVLTLLTHVGIDSRLAMITVIAVNVPLTFALTRFILRKSRVAP